MSHVEPVTECKTPHTGSVKGYGN